MICTKIDAAIKIPLLVEFSAKQKEVTDLINIKNRFMVGTNISWKCTADHKEASYRHLQIKRFPQSLPGLFCIKKEKSSAPIVTIGIRERAAPTTYSS